MCTDPLAWIRLLLAGAQKHEHGQAALERHAQGEGADPGHDGLERSVGFIAACAKRAVHIVDFANPPSPSEFGDARLGRGLLSGADEATGRCEESRCQDPCFGPRQPEQRGLQLRRSGRFSDWM